MSTFHQPVLLQETLLYLKIKQGGLYIDCNLGGAGHTREIVRRGGIVLGLDQDQDAIDFVSERERDSINARKLLLRKTNFANLEQIAIEEGFKNIDGILFDLGVSTHQLESAQRGFSFNKEAKLDMRMDKNSAVTAADLVNMGSENELSHLFWKYGEERFHKQIAKAVVSHRKNKKIESTNDLANIVLSVRQRTTKDHMHPATRIFQALRIAINNELQFLQEALPQSGKLLNFGGRLLVISFHSLEDRIVKDYLLGNKEGVKMITKKPIVATDEEIILNPKERSAKLRVGEKSID